MDLSFIVQAISSSPIWFRWAVSMWVLAGALLFVRFITFEAMPKQSNQVGLNSEASVKSETKRPTISFKEFIAKAEDLSGRFLELDEFKKKWNNASVTWEGIVGSVSQDERNVIIALMADTKQRDLVVVFCPLDMRTKVFSYHMNDRIKVTGLLDSPSIGGLSIKATETSFLGPLQVNK